MSGTSLDGLDVCYAGFAYADGGWDYEILAATTYSYDQIWLDKLSGAMELDKSELDILDKEFGTYIGQRINEFIHAHGIKTKIDLICSHGHTVFHQPENEITLQIGDGPAIANSCGIDVVNDFRIGDVLLGGQGAPLVPVGDRLLFSDFDACLNLGGFSNISFEKGGKRVAFDISPANLPLNRLARKVFGLDYDKKGEIAGSSEVNTGLLRRLNNIPFYRQDGPKSLGVEWLNNFFYPILNDFSSLAPAVIMRTIVEHETDQIAAVINKEGLKRVLVTGGGAKNIFFMRCLQRKTTAELVVPDVLLLDFKEALIFGLLGVLRLRNEINTYASVTGAKRDSVGGKIYSVG